MRGRIDTTGIEEGGGFALISPGWYLVDIVEVDDGETKNGDYMAKVKYNVKEGEFEDNWLWDNIIISNNPDSPGYKILGRSKHFLHCIGEPYEGEIEYDTERWLYKSLKVKVYHEEYKSKEVARVDAHDFAVSEDDRDLDESIPF